MRKSIRIFLGLIRTHCGPWNRIGIMRSDTAIGDERVKAWPKNKYIVMKTISVPALDLSSL